MVTKKGKRALLTAVSILVVLLALVGTIAIMKAVSDARNSADKTSSPETTSTSDTNTSNTSDSEPSVSPDDSVSSDTSDSSNPNSDANQSTSPSIDPSTTAAIDITPMSISVSYVKGVGGFEFEVLRRPSGAHYVEFRSPKLIGTKCTDDEGAFASILESPTADESAALSQKITVDGTEYGLSLATAACTSDPSLLSKYQQSFNDAFSLLKKI